MRMTSIYIAASSAPSEHGRVTAAFTACELLDLDVYDWRTGHRPTAELTRHERITAANADIDAIVGADLVWVLAPAVRSDALVEMGYALAWVHAVRGPTRANVIVSGPLASRGIFAALAEEHDEDSEALAAIRRRVEEGRA